MNAWQPTDEQMVEFARGMIRAGEAIRRRHGYTNAGDLAWELPQQPAFQAIIRSAVDAAVKDVRAERDEAIQAACDAVRKLVAYERAAFPMLTLEDGEVRRG